MTEQETKLYVTRGILKAIDWSTLPPKDMPFVIKLLADIPISKIWEMLCDEVPEEFRDLIMMGILIQSRSESPLK